MCVCVIPYASISVCAYFSILDKSKKRNNRPLCARDLHIRPSARSHTRSKTHPHNGREREREKEEVEGREGHVVREECEGEEADHDEKKEHGRGLESEGENSVRLRMRG